MALETERYVVLDNEATAKQNACGDWWEILGRWFVQCPKCLEAWLAPGGRENDSHICRYCGFRFVKSSTKADLRFGQRNMMW